MSGTGSSSRSPNVIHSSYNPSSAASASSSNARPSPPVHVDYTDAENLIKLWIADARHHGPPGDNHGVLRLTWDQQYQKACGALRVIKECLKKSNNTAHFRAFSGILARRQEGANGVGNTYNEILIFCRQLHEMGLWNWFSDEFIWNWQHVVWRREAAARAQARAQARVQPSQR
ncbi:MAG: hypothetical protein Q9220_006284 [cf. Caloplaca sp. 1 TL-2023]